MNNNEFITINDMSFEDLLKSSVPYKPPEEIINIITPWKKAIKRIMWGLGLSIMSLNLFYLNIILPIIGMILLLLGLRVLRNENKWFKAYYMFAIADTVYMAVLFIVNTIPTFKALVPEEVFLVTNVSLPFIELILFCKSFYTAEKDAGITPRKAPVISLILWYALLVCLAIVNFTGYLLPYVMIIGFVVIMVSLGKISKEIDEIGYSIKNAPVKISDSMLTAIVAVVMVSCFAFGFISGRDGYKMQWQVKDQSEHGSVQQIKTDLISLGFPEKVLDDMSAEDILACEGATQVVTDMDKHPFNKGREVKKVTEYSESTHIYTTTVYDVEEMAITGIGVRLKSDDGRTRWKIIHHFDWTVNPGFYGTESIQLWPAYKNNRGWFPDSAFTGRVLYTKDGVDYVSPYHSIGDETYTSENIFFGTQTDTDVFATFSLPGEGENQRGYLSYTIIDNSESGYIIDSWFNYTHQISFLQYPVVTAKEKRQSSNLNDDYPFRTVQDALQFNEDGSFW